MGLSISYLAPPPLRCSEGEQQEIMLHSLVRQRSRQCKRFFSTDVCFYKVLGIGENAEQSAIKSAYLALSLKYHPDVSTQSNAEDEFKKISVAYDTLGNPSKRARYDIERVHSEYNVSSFYEATYAPTPQPTRGPSALSKAKQISPLAMFIFLAPTLGLLAMCLSTLNDTADSSEKLIPMCYDPKRKEWVEYTYHTMHRFRGVEVRYRSKQAGFVKKRPNAGYMKSG